MPTIAVNPMRCRVWNLHGRLDENLTEESCKTEIESFERHGQLVPALGRRLRGSPDYDVELIYGARRLFVARHLNVPLLVEVRDVSDRDGIIAMDLENRLRQDVSAFERATSYDRWLREGHFKSQEEITSALRVSPAQLSRLLKLARLPSVVIEAFKSATEICEVWGAELANLLKESEAERRVIQAARSIAAVSPRPPAAEIYKQLCIAGKGDRVLRGAERIVKDAQGEELFRIKQQRSSIVFNISLELLSQESLDALERAIARVMDPKLPADLEMDLDADVDVDAAEEDPADATQEVWA
jgi:ParB family transcriptional regulator, chromosome partitioning protein